MSDEDLARAALGLGGGDSFVELFTRYHKIIFLSCLGFFRDGHRAEDATQETFLRAYKNLKSFDGRDFGAWLMRIGKNVCIDEWRKARRQDWLSTTEVADDLAANGQPSFDQLVMAGKVRKELRQLPTGQRQCLEMKINGYSYEETAARTGLTVKEVKSNIQNGRRMIWLRVVKEAPIAEAKRREPFWHR